VIGGYRHRRSDQERQQADHEGTNSMHQYSFVRDHELGDPIRAHERLRNRSGRSSLNGCETLIG
jgi:hypothetical protein